MKLEARIRGTELTIFVSGEVDHHAAKDAMLAIQDQLDRFLPRTCILDLAGVTFMDSSGIAIILKTQRRMREISATASVENVPVQAMRVLTAAGIHRYISVKPLRAGKEQVHK